MTLTPPNPSLVEKLVYANRILYDQGIVDGLGHVSVRHDSVPGVYLLSCNRAPGLVQRGDIVCYNLDGDAVSETTERPYLERFIHSEIYKARPDVQSVLHSHSPAVLPYCCVDRPLRPVIHMGAFLGDAVPVYEIRDKHGDSTDLFGNAQDVCADIAEALGTYPVVLMARHGVVNVGNSIREVVYRAIYLELNASIQTTSLQVGKINYLTPGEIDMAGKLVGAQIDRGWEHWSQRLKWAGMA